MLQFITHCRNGYDEISGAAAVLAGGCRWIQLRMKDASPGCIVAVGKELRKLCTDYGATLILDDHVELVAEIGADGAHLGRNDMPVAEARAILGPGKIIGATANTFVHMIEAVEAGADYIGLGPFRFTTTKQRLSPVLGLEGYHSIMHQFSCVSQLPVVGIGGIEAADVPSIMATGVSGVAVSGSLLSANDVEKETEKFVKLTTI